MDRKYSVATELAKLGIRNTILACPGFDADCSLIIYLYFFVKFTTQIKY